MSRLTKWKTEKTKIKVVFRLQFHATNIPQTGWEKLFISFIPADSGKATSKTTKANVRNGTCKWADPIYETTRLLQDVKSKHYDEKLYKLVVAMGSPRSSILGASMFNLADYADALKPSTVVLSLQGCDYGTTLHVTVQLLTSKTGFREFEQQRDLRERGLQSPGNQNSPDEYSGQRSSFEATAHHLIDKVNESVRLKAQCKELPSLEEGVGLDEQYADSAVGLDGSSNTSESLYAERHDVSSIPRIENLKRTTSGDLVGHSISQNPQSEKGDTSNHCFLSQHNDDRFHGRDSSYPVDNDLAFVYEENSQLRRSFEIEESAISDLKMEVVHLKCQTDELNVETQKFAEQVAAEMASGKELAEEVAVLKSECSQLKGDIDQLQKLKSSYLTAGKEVVEVNQDHIFEKPRLGWLKGISLMEDKIRVLLGNACLRFHERDLAFLHPEIEMLLSFLLELKQGLGEADLVFNSVPPERANAKEIQEMNLNNDEHPISGTEFGTDLCQPDDIFQCLRILEAFSREPNARNATNIIKGKLFELLRELDESRAERENFAKKMDKMECYYEGLVQELEENQKQLLGELQNLRNEHSTCLYTISSAATQMETMRQDMNEQLLRFSKDRHELDVLNEELQRRATTSEAALRKARSNYSTAVDQLQKGLEILSSQVLSMFEINENIIHQGLTEDLRSCFERYPEIPQDWSRKSEASDELKLLSHQHQNTSAKKQHGADMLLEDLKKSLHLQEDLCQKGEEELGEMHLVNLHMDIFSKILLETLLDAGANYRCMRDEIDGLKHVVEESTESKELLMRRLEDATDNIQSLNEYKINCIAKYNKQIQLLEDKLTSVMGDNCNLRQKIAELETWVRDCESYERKYEACVAAYKELENLMKQETLQNRTLQNELILLGEELEVSKNKCNELAYARDGLHKTVDLAKDRLGVILAKFGEQYNKAPLCEDVEVKDIMVFVLQLEEFQLKACEEALLLMQEKQELESERDVARASLEYAKSETSTMKEKFEHELWHMKSNLEISNARAHRLESELEAVANRLKIISEVEEKCGQHYSQLVFDFTSFEGELKQFKFKNEDLDQELSDLKSVSEELESSTLKVADLMHKNQDLESALHEKADESIHLTLEINCLIESLRYLQNKLLIEGELREKLESTMTNLSSKLMVRDDELLYFDQQRNELFHCKQQVSNLEIEKSKLVQSLLHHEKSLGKYCIKPSPIPRVEALLSELHELLVAADIEVIVNRTQTRIQVEKLSEQLQFSHRHVEELCRKCLDMESKLDYCAVSEAHYIEENTRIRENLGTLKSELEAFHAQHSSISNSNGIMAIEGEKCNNSDIDLQVSLLKEQNDHVLEIEQLNCLLDSAQEDNENLTCTKQELEIKVTIMRAKLDELQGQLTFLDGCKDEQMRLENKCNELSQRLSEQASRSEEFRILSVHLKELKDRADGELLQLRQKREAESPSVVMQESLRIAFIKEQYENKLQELRHQFSMSKKHGEEMLLKLQDSVNEIENRKKSEALYLRRNEELLRNIFELEAELQSVTVDKHEITKASDRIRAELECSLMSLECCKEEKQRYLNQNRVDSEKEENACSLSVSKDKMSSVLVTLPHPQDALFLGGAHRNPGGALANTENLLRNDNCLYPVNDNFESQTLKSSMECLHNELERMKMENTLLPPDDLYFDSNGEGVETEMMQLRKVNEELCSIYSPFYEFSRSGNALKKVVALEIELAEVLQAKKNCSIHFQSDEEAIFRSFRDINELITDMLDLKGKYAAAETELKEMHGRYSQLSLRFAEVEGERQKLMMTLKNFQASKKPF